MTQERIECPFCAELIMPGAVKCRFCGEWFSAHEPNVKESRSAEVIDRSAPRREAQRGAVEDSRQQYLTTIQGVEKRHRPIEKIEHRANSVPNKSDGYADCAVGAPDRVESRRQRCRGGIKDIRQHAEPLEKTQNQDSGLSDRGDSRESKQEKDGNAVEVSPVSKVAEVSSTTTSESEPLAQGARLEKTQHRNDCLPDGDDNTLGGQHKGQKVVEVSPVPVWTEFSSAKALRSSPVYRGARIKRTQGGDTCLPDGDDPASEQHK